MPIAALLVPVAARSMRTDAPWMPINAPLMPIDSPMMPMQEAVGKTWVLYDMSVLTAMLICLITYGVYIQSLKDFSPQNTYEVYDSLGAAQARLLLPKKNGTSSYNGEGAYKGMLTLPACRRSC